jgi:hypothetical protein
MLRLVQLLRRPVDDYVAALRTLAVGHGWLRIAVLLGAAASTWWVYVPLHELAHAFGCLLGGGSVSRLDIDPVYGAALLQRIFPFVHVGSDYAGQLAGFDTRGSDATYLLTDFLPFLGTILLGVPLLRAAGRDGSSPAVQAARFGASLPLAFAPFLSLTGDYYEMGSIVVSRVAAWLTPGVPVTRWRGDDLFKLAGQLFGNGGTGSVGDVAGMAASFALGVVLAFLTYAVGGAWAGVIERWSASRTTA